jgi:uncharacterized protein YjiS (DUF1127 family)
VVSKHAPSIFLTSNDTAQSTWAVGLMEELTMMTNPLERFAAALGTMRKRHRAGRKLSALEMLNDHTLRDIGIHRSQIEAFGALANDNRRPHDLRWSA